MENTLERWHAARTGNHQGLVISDDTGENIAVTYKAENAPLVAASPELLSACIRMMVGITKQSTPTCEWYEGIEFDAADEARDAIAKAEGR